MIIAQFYPLILIFLWPISWAIGCVILGFSNGTSCALFFVGICVLAKIYNNIFYYVWIPYGQIYYENGTVQFDQMSDILTPQEMCLLDTFQILGKRMRLYSKKDCIWINLTKTRHDENRIQYYPGTEEFNIGSLDEAYALFYMGLIPCCKYYIIRDDKGVFYITDISHYPEDELSFTLVATMISKNIYTLSQLCELDRIRGKALFSALTE